MSSLKRKRDESDDMGTDDEEGYGQLSPVARSGRVRKKSAKVLEMEEAEELEKKERKSWKMEKKPPPKKLKAKAAGSSVATPKSDSSMTAEPNFSTVIEEEIISSEPLKMKLNLTGMVPEKLPKKKATKVSIVSTTLKEEPAEKISFLHSSLMSAVDQEKEEPVIKLEKKKKQPDNDSPQRRKNLHGAVNTPELLSAFSPAKEPDLPLQTFNQEMEKIPLSPSTIDDELNSSDDDDGHDDLDDDGDQMDDDEEGDDEPVQYADTAQMAMKVQTSSEKKAGRKKREKKDLDKPKKKKVPTATLR